MPWAVGAAIAAIIAAAVSSAAAISQAQTQSATAKYNKKVAENAAIAQRQAAEIEAANKREEDLRRAAASRAAIGGAGVMGDVGTPLLIELENAETAKLNEARIRYSGEVGAQQYESEAAITSFVGKRAATGSYMQAGASLLQGAGSAAGAYGRYSRGSAT